MLALLTVTSEVEGHTGLIEFRMRHKDDFWLHVETLRTNLMHDPNVKGIVLNTRDVSERMKRHAQVQSHARIACRLPAQRQEVRARAFEVSTGNRAIGEHPMSERTRRIVLGQPEPEPQGRISLPEEVERLRLHLQHLWIEEVRAIDSLREHDSRLGPVRPVPAIKVVRRLSFWQAV